MSLFQHAHADDTKTRTSKRIKRYTNLLRVSICGVKGKKKKKKKDKGQRSEVNGENQNTASA